MSPQSPSPSAPLRALAACLVATACTLAPPVRAQSTLPAPAVHDGAHDFDFIIGHWHAHLRKRLHPLTGSAEWVEYDGTSVIDKLWDGRANSEEFDVASRDPRVADRPRIEGQTLRLYDPASGQWSLYLVDAAKGRVLLPATIGAFADGRGEFFDHEEIGGRWILVRYQWTQPAPGRAHMEQAFSPDGGAHWEVNWICDLAPPAP